MLIPTQPKWLPVLTVLTLLFNLLPGYPVKIARADTTPSLAITEIMYDLPGTDTDREWVEITNLSPATIDLTGYKFNDGSNHNLNPPPQNGGQGSMLIAPNECVIFASDAATFLTLYPGYHNNVIDTVMSLPNTTKTLSLFDTKGTRVDSITYQSSQGANGNGFTLERVFNNGQPTDKLTESALWYGTPGAPSHPYETPQISASNLSPATLWLDQLPQIIALSVKVISPNDSPFFVAGNGLKSVSADLTALQLTPTTLHDDGIAPDTKAGDGIYSTTITLTKTLPTGSFPILIAATDLHGVTMTQTSFLHLNSHADLIANWNQTAATASTATLSWTIPQPNLLSKLQLKWQPQLATTWNVVDLSPSQTTWEVVDLSPLQNYTAELVSYDDANQPFVSVPQIFRTAGTSAMPNQILITEVMADPAQSGTDTSYEWFELYNPTAQPQTLAGWSITDNSESDTLPTLTLEPDTYWVIAATTQALPDITQRITFLPDQSIGNGLGNTGDQLALKDFNGSIIDALSWGTDITYSNPAIKTPSAGNSLQRNTHDPATLFQFTSASPTPLTPYVAPISSVVPAPQPIPVPVSLPISQPVSTPLTSPISIPGPNHAEPVVYSSSILLNEILPSPGSQTDWNHDGRANEDDEWIELFNAGNSLVDLGGWQLDDVQNGGSAPFTIPAGTTIAAQNFLVFWHSSPTQPSTKLILNNTGDTVNLIAPDGIVKDQITYPPLASDLAYARNPTINAWTTTTSPTPGQTNLITAAVSTSSLKTTAFMPTGQVLGATINAIPQLAIAAAKTQPLNSQVQVQGIVTSLPNQLATHRLYLQDSTAGIAVESSDFPALSLGQPLTVIGNLSLKYGEWVIKATAMTIGEGQTPWMPQSIVSTDIGPATQGALVKLVGHIVQSSGNTFWISDASGQTKIILQASTGITKPRLHQGMSVAVTGIVSRYFTSATLGNGYRLLPRQQTDVSFSLPPTGPDVSLTLILIVAILILFFLMQLVFSFFRPLHAFPLPRRHHRHCQAICHPTPGR